MFATAALAQAPRPPVDKFTRLLDAPKSYAGHAFESIRVNGAMTALEFGGGIGGGGSTNWGDIYGVISDQTDLQSALDEKITKKAIKVTTDYAIQPGDLEVLADASLSAITIFLPVSAADGQPYHIKKVDDSSNVVTVATQSGDLIDGAALIGLTEQYADALLIAGDANYWDNTGTSGDFAFLDLSDTPSSYSGQSGKIPAVNATEDGLEFIVVSGTGTVTNFSAGDLSPLFTTTEATTTTTPALNFVLSNADAHTFLSNNTGSSAPPSFVAATTANIDASTDRNYVTDAELTVIGNTSGTNTGDQDLSGYQPLDADLTAIAALTGTDTIYYRSAANTWTPVAIGSNIDFIAGTLSANGNITFLSLSDTPSSYSGEAGKVAAVNATEDGLEFIPPPSGGGMTIGDPVTSGNANDILFVDGSGNLGQNDGFTFDGTTATIPGGIVNAATGFQIGGAGASGHYLRGNGTTFVDGTIQVADVPTLNQNTTGSAATLTTGRNLWGQSFNGSANVAGNIELGTDGTTDTTLARASAGVASVEGVNLLRTSDIVAVPGFGFTADGSGGTVATGVAGYVTVHGAGTITGWSIVATGSSPTCTIDVWKIASGTALPTVTNTIMGTKPALSTGNVKESTTMTGWTTTFSDGDVFGFNVDAVANATRITFQLTRSQ